MMSGSQPPPGFYLSGLYLRYDADTLRDRDGNSIAIDPEERGSTTANAFAVGLWYVTNLKLLGANYSVMAFPGIADNKFEVPILGFESSATTGFTDLYVQPINLGWHTTRADYTAGFGLYMPTGRYDVNADDNIGLGMWSFEFFGGTTVYFDEAKSWTFATTAFYETHTEKKDTDIKVGDILTLEGGGGKSFLDGALSVGAAYYAQFKVTHDQPGAEIEEVLQGRELGKHRSFGVGPEVTIPIATSRTYIGAVNARYFWEFGSRTTLEGSTFVLSATFPIPSIPLQ
jgi:hypothetical protein